MAQDTVKARIRLKTDTESNWNKALNFVPLKGEVIVYSIDESHPFCRLKIGDGKTNVVGLPFIDSATINGKQLIIGSTEEWRQQLSFVPNAGDIICYTDKVVTESGTRIPGIKIGDGKAYCVDLPFVGDDIAEQLLAHISDTGVHITEDERMRWNNKLNCEDFVQEENLILNRN